MATLTKPLAVTMGDPSGIGPELILKSWHARKAQSLHPFFAIAAPELFPSNAIALINDPCECFEYFEEKLPVIPLNLMRNVQPGKPSADNSQAILQSIQEAHRYATQRKASGVVTAPVNKQVLYEAGFTHPGQTEYLAELCDTDPNDTVMMLAAPMLRVVPLTIHIPLRDVAAALTQDLILSRATTVLKALTIDFGIRDPRLAVCGLNPHAGEDGHIGQEEQDIISPALQKLRESGHQVIGPISADSLFHEDALAHYDAALAMYHDQALIPLKTLDFHNGVNTTLGLPIIRTSPDHGTAYNIAGKNKADPRSMIAALKLAETQALNRAKHGH